MNLFEGIFYFIVSLSAAYGFWTFLQGKFCQYKKDEEDREKVCDGTYCFSHENCPYYIEK